MKTSAPDALKLPPDQLRSRLDTPICDLFDSRTVTFLEERGMATAEDVLRRTPDQLLSISNIGEKTLEQIYLALEGIGFYRKGRGPCAAEACSAAIPSATGRQGQTDVQSSA